MPDWAIALFSSGAVADIAIAVLLVETAALLIMRKRFGFHAGSLLLNAASGISLMLALRGALTGPENYIWIALFLIAGFIAHIGDVWMRARRTV